METTITFTIKTTLTVTNEDLVRLQDKLTDLSQVILQDEGDQMFITNISVTPQTEN